MRLMPLYRALAGGMVAAMAACGGGGETPIGVDAGVEPADAGTSQDAGEQHSLTDDLIGGWRFEAGEPGAPVLSCGVIIGAGTFEITCADPFYPHEINSTCTQIRGDSRITGELTGDKTPLLNGGVDLIEEYEGDGCAAEGYTTGVPMVTMGLAWLWAQRVEPAENGGFWSAVDGTWSFELTDGLDPAKYTACTVHLDGGSFDIYCPDPLQREPTPGCYEMTVDVGSGAVEASAMSGEVFDVFDREGPTCEAAGYPLHEEGVHLPISATRL
jgi:hypothetical protein